MLSPAFEGLAAERPLALARSIIGCFRSWARAGFLLDDFKPQQFTLKGEDVFLVDGPSLLEDSAIGAVVAAAFPKCKDLLPPPSVNATCAKDDDCPRTKAHHACARPGDCEAEARGAPEARGACRARACLGLSEKTHVYDLASRPWLLPAVARRARSPASVAVIERLCRKARADDPRDRPSFDSMIADLDRQIADASGL